MSRKIEEMKRKWLEALMEEYLQNFDMSDEESYTAESDGDTDYEEESENGESDLEEHKSAAKKRKIVVNEVEEEDKSAAKKRKIIVKEVGASCSSVVQLLHNPILSDSESYSSSSSEVESHGDDPDSWGPIVKNFKKLFFNIPVGVPVNLAAEIQGRSELDIFLKIVTEEVCELMAVQTNIYAEQKIIDKIVNGTVGPKSRLNEWVPTSAAEMKKLLGIIIWMGLDRKPTLKDYWSRSLLFTSPASKFMPRNRFEILLQMWHFSNNEECPPGDRLYKIQPLIDIINRNFKNCLNPSENVYIDESMVPFRGRIAFREYIQGEGHKFGFKVFKLCFKGGYTYRIKIYCGMDKSAGKVVFELMDEMLNDGRTLYTDNCYTSVGLAKQLLEKKTHLVGTLRINRKENPKAVVSKKLKQGEIYGEEKDGIVVAKWRDKSDILFLSTKHGDEMTAVSTREGGARNKPSAICDYNSAKSFIDTSDKMTSYSTALRRTVKWFRKIAVEVLTGTSLVNAWILYNQVNDKSVPITTFRENLCLQLLEGDDTTDKDIDAETSTGIHELHTTDKRKRCKFCYVKFSEERDRKYAMKHSKQVTYVCLACPEKPPICVECFFRIHKSKPK